MFVLVTDVSTSDLAPDPLRSACAYPANMVWVDPEEEVESEPRDGEQHRKSGRGMRVFGPFETYEEGEYAATMLAAGGDYRVIPVDPVTGAVLRQ